MTRKDQNAGDLSPVFAHGEAAKPRVRAPDSPMTVWVGVIGAGILGFVVFNGLSGARQAHARRSRNRFLICRWTIPPARSG